MFEILISIKILVDIVHFPTSGAIRKRRSPKRGSSGAIYMAVMVLFHASIGCPPNAIISMMVPFPPADGALRMSLSERQKKGQPESRPKNVVLFGFLAVPFPLRRCEYAEPQK